MDGTFYISKRTGAGEHSYMGFDSNRGWFLTSKFAEAKLWDGETTTIEALRQLVKELGSHKAFKAPKKKLYDALHLCRIGSMDSMVEYVAGEEE